MLAISLAVNILVLVPVCVNLARSTLRMSKVFGPRSPARDILFCVYMAILVASILLLVMLRTGSRLLATHASGALLTVQIIYKLLSCVVVGGGVPDKLPFNPVVASNAAIAVLHLVSLIVCFVQ